MGTPLVITDEVREQIRALCTLAEANPVGMIGLTHRLATVVGTQRHMEQMTRQTIPIPLAFMVTFSIELGHPAGDCRHMSMSVQHEGRVPNPEAVWMIAKEFGFWGNAIETSDCAVWLEDLAGHGEAVNVVQPMAQPATFCPQRIEKLTRKEGFFP